jgi:adenylate cyclase
MPKWPAKLPWRWCKSFPTWKLSGGLRTGPSFRPGLACTRAKYWSGTLGPNSGCRTRQLATRSILSSRLEGLNKLYGTLILASGQTKRETGNQFEWRYIDRVAVLGRSQGTDVFELLGNRSTVPSDKLELRDEYEAGLKKYFHGDFQTAAVHFSAVLAHRPDDGASQVLLARCNQLALRPVPGLWSGIYEMLEK